MSQFFEFYNNFTSGELSPWMSARSDLAQYQNGAFTLKNFLPRPEGGIERRPGSVFVARTKYPTKTCRLIDYTYDASESYILEVGDLYIRLYKDDARIEGGAITVSNAIDNGSGLIRLTANSHGLATGDHVAVRGVRGTYEANGDWVCTVIDANTIDLQGSTFTNTYVSGGTVNYIVELASPWTEADLPDLRWSQSGNALFLVHPKYWPRLFQRISSTSWSLTKIDNNSSSTLVPLKFVGGPFQALNRDQTHTMTPSAQTGSITITSSKDYFDASMVGMFMRIGDKDATTNLQGYVHIDSYTSPTQVSATVMSKLDGTSATDNWALGAFGSYSGFPKDVTYFDQRLVLAGTTAEPYTVWMSAVGAEFDFTVGVNPDDAVTFTLASDTNDAIQWVASFTDLLIGTQGALHIAYGGNDSAITPTNVIVEKQATYGSANSRSLGVGDTVIYVQRGGTKVRDVGFSLEEDKFLSSDLNIMSSHIFDGDPVVDTAFQLNPFPTVWFVRQSGKVAAMLIVKDQRILAWSQHETRSGDAIEQIVSTPRTDKTRDDVWWVAKRTINGTTVRYVERLDPAVYVDCALYQTYGSATSTIYDLEFLNGETVDINGDGAVYTSRAVSNGMITLNTTENPITTVQVGLGFTSTLVTTDPQPESDRRGPVFGTVKRFNRVNVFVYKTLTLYVNGIIAPSRKPEDLTDTALPIPEKEVLTFTSLSSDYSPQLTVTQSLPLAANILSVWGQVVYGD